MYDKYVYLYVKTMNKNYKYAWEKNKLWKKKYNEILAWAMKVFIYLHVFVVYWLCAVGFINVQTGQTDWYV